MEDKQQIKQRDLMGEYEKNKQMDIPYLEQFWPVLNSSIGSVDYVYDPPQPFELKLYLFANPKCLYAYYHHSATGQLPISSMTNTCYATELTNIQGTTSTIWYNYSIKVY